MGYYALKWTGKRLWYSYWGAIGPAFTESRRDCQKFKTEKEAMQHPAFSWPLSIVEVRKYQGGMK